MCLPEKVMNIIARQALLDPKELRPEHSLEELGIDSMGVVEIIFAIEEEFDISIPFNANASGVQGDMDISSVASVISAIATLASERAD